MRRKRPQPFSAFTDGQEGGFQHAIDQITDAGPLPDQSALLQDQSAIIWQCIQALPPKQQQVIHLRFYVDDSLEDIAAALGCSVGTVKSRLFHALENLRAMNAMRGQFINPQLRAATL